VWVWEWVGEDIPGAEDEDGPGAVAVVLAGERFPGPV